MIAAIDPFWKTVVTVLLIFLGVWMLILFVVVVATWKDVKKNFKEIDKKFGRKK